MVGADRVLMGRCGVAKNPHDLVLRQQSAIVHGKQQRLADRKGGLACMFARVDIRVSFLGIVNRER
jgi:hypothetical protein